MDWQNERYVRIYTRDTADLLAVGWEGRAVLWEMIRKADRAGVVDGDADTLPDLLRMPAQVVEAGLPKLLRRGCVERGAVDGSPVFVVPNYMAAQEAKQSDKQRQRESRARRRDTARGVTKRDETSHEAPERDNVTDCDATVTPRDEKSHAVTRGHSVSQPVTPSLAVPSLAVPSLAVPSRAERSARARETTRAPDSVDPKAEMIAELLREHPRFARLAGIDDLAQSLLGVSGAAAFNLTEADALDAIGRAAVEAEGDANEGQLRRMLGWKFQDVERNRRQRLRQRPTDDCGRPLNPDGTCNAALPDNNKPKPPNAPPMWEVDPERWGGPIPPPIKGDAPRVNMATIAKISAAKKLPKVEP